MPKLRHWLMAVLIAGAAACAPAPGADPAATVEALYEPYLENRTAGPLRESAPLTEELRALMRRAEEASNASGEPMAAVDFNPIIDGQDWELSDVSVELVAPPADGRAQVRANFQNFGEDVALTYDLRDQDGGWRIDNISGKNWTLRQLLADEGIAPESEAE